MIRTADAAGFDGVMLSKASADLYSLKTLRSMQGSHFHIPIWKLDREELLERAAHSHLAVLATTLSEASIDYRQLPQTDQFILVMGNEGNGISQEMAAQADQLVHIPMPGRAEFEIVSSRNFDVFFKEILRKKVYLTCKKKLMEILLGELINERWLSYAISS